MALRQTIGKADVALARSRVPPTAHFARMSGIAQVHNHVKLIVVGIGGIEVGGAGGQVRELAVDEPHAMDSARIWARGIEEREFEIL